MSKSDIFNYEHPFVTVDGIILRFRNNALEVLLMKRDTDPEKGRWSLPGGFVGVDARMEDTLRQKVLDKTGVSGFYMEQLKTYDAFQRDPRGRVLSVAYLCITNQQNQPGCWFRPGKFELEGPDGEKIPYGDLAFDHGFIIHDALERLRGKLWYTDIMRHFLPDEFTILQVQTLCEAIEGKKNTNLRRRLEGRIDDTGNIKEYGAKGGRHAALYRWLKKGD